MTETKIPDKVYCRNRLGSKNLGSQAGVTTSTGEQDRVDLVVRERPDGWIVESMRFRGPNVIICEVVLGGQQTPLIML